MSNIFFDPTQDNASPVHTLGQRGKDDQGHEYIYVKAESAIDRYDVCAVYEDHDASPILASNSDKGDRAAVAVDLAVPSGHYAWLSLYGKGLVKAKASCARHVTLYTSATAGFLDDTTASQEKITGIYLTAARSNTDGTAPAIWFFPYNE